jgi:uncharacterized membrane protein YqhA
MEPTMQKTSPRLPASADRAPMFERFFETLLWSSRFIIAVPVVVSLLIGLGVLIVTTVDALGLSSLVGDYFGATVSHREELRLDIIEVTVAVVDGYLLAAIMLIFGLGLYELFISSIDSAANSRFAQHLLHITSIDDLKNQLARVIILILIVKFFELALELKYETVQDLFLLAAALLLVGGALYVSNRGKKSAATADKSSQSE